MSGFELLAEVKAYNDEARERAFDEAFSAWPTTPNSPAYPLLAPPAPLDTVAATPGMRRACTSRSW